MHSWHNDMDRALIEPCPSYMLYHFLNSATIKKIIIYLINPPKPLYFQGKSAF